MSWLNSRAVELLNSSISVKFFNLSTIKTKNLFTTHYSQFTKKVFAFTLAETLIVMGVIGVVAALTLPNLNSSTNNKEKVVKLKKIYSNLEDAYGRAVAVYGPIDTWQKDDNNSDRFASRLKDFMKVAKYCDHEHTKECLDMVDLDYKLPAIILPDGTSMLFSVDFDCNDTTSLKTLGPVCGAFEIDLDGNNKGKNYFGIDRFSFLVTKDNGIIPRHSRDSLDDITKPYPNCCFGKKSSNPRWRYYSCTAWVIENGNMDYLYADENGKCENSNVTLSETVTSCN